jgi:hypothetical protein
MVFKWRWNTGYLAIFVKFRFSYSIIRHFVYQDMHIFYLNKLTRSNNCLNSINTLEWLLFTIKYFFFIEFLTILVNYVLIWYLNSFSDSIPFQTKILSKNSGFALLQIY